MNLANVRESSLFGGLQTTHSVRPTVQRDSVYNDVKKQQILIFSEAGKLKTISNSPRNWLKRLNWWYKLSTTPLLATYRFSPSAHKRTLTHAHSFDNNCISNGSTVVKKSMPQWLRLLTCMCSRSLFFFFFFFWLIAKNHRAKPESSSMIVP